MSSGKTSDDPGGLAHGWLPRISSALRHPVAVVVISSAFSMLIVPWISARMNDRRLIREARLQRCVEILNFSREADQRLNTMVTTMEMFIKDCMSGGHTSEQDRREVGLELARQYRDFDQQAWWWLSQLRTEAGLLRIAVDEKALEKITAPYKANVIQSTNVLDSLWTECLRREPRPSPDLMWKKAESVRNEMDALQRQRGDLIGKLVYLFAPEESTIQHLLSEP